MSYFTAMTQDAIVSTLNSSSANVASGASFVGLSESTLGVNSIQVTLKSDQNCTVYIDQSPDGVNWDISDNYSYFSSIGNFSITNQAVNSYFRVRVTNNGSVLTTVFRLQSVLCPIADPLPRSTDEDGHLSVCVRTIEDRFGEDVKATPHDELRVEEPIKLAGAPFGNILDTSLWTVTNTNGGTTTANYGTCLLQTNTSANGASFVTSVRLARYLSGSANIFRTVPIMSPGVANNKRRGGVANFTNYHFTITSASATVGDVYSNNSQQFTVLSNVVSGTTLVTYGSGAPSASGTLTKVSGAGTSSITFSSNTLQSTTPSDGAYYELNGTTFSVVICKAGIETRVSSGSFNGTLGSAYTPLNNGTPYEIMWTSSKVYFIVGNYVLHTFTATTSSLYATEHFYIFFDNVNSAGITSNNTLTLINAHVKRLGHLLSQPRYYYFSGQTAGTLVKSSPGNLKTVIINAVANAVVTIYDGISTSGNILWAGTLTNNTLLMQNVDFKDMPFYNGIFFVVSAQNANLLFIFD